MPLTLNVIQSFSVGTYTYLPKYKGLMFTKGKINIMIHFTQTFISFAYWYTEWIQQNYYDAIL
jgi:hypothetical protein